MPGTTPHLVSRTWLSSHECHINFDPDNLSRESGEFGRVPLILLSSGHLLMSLLGPDGASTHFVMATPESMMGSSHSSVPGKPHMPAREVELDLAAADADGQMVPHCGERHHHCGDPRQRPCLGAGIPDDHDSTDNHNSPYDHNSTYDRDQEDEREPRVHCRRARGRPFRPSLPSGPKGHASSLDSGDDVGAFGDDICPCDVWSVYAGHVPAVPDTEECCSPM